VGWGWGRGRWQAAQRSREGGDHGGWIGEGCLDPAVTGLHGAGSTRSRIDDNEEEETEDQLNHQRKRGGEQRHARFRV
jgi:hypothetical protein